MSESKRLPWNKVDESQDTVKENVAAEILKIKAREIVGLNNEKLKEDGGISLAVVMMNMGFDIPITNELRSKIQSEALIDMDSAVAKYCEHDVTVSQDLADAVICAEKVRKKKDSYVTYDVTKNGMIVAENLKIDDLKEYFNVKGFQGYVLDGQKKYKGFTFKRNVPDQIDREYTQKELELMDEWTRVTGWFDQLKKKKAVGV